MARIKSARLLGTCFQGSFGGRTDLDPLTLRYFARLGWRR